MEQYLHISESASRCQSSWRSVSICFSKSHIKSPYMRYGKGLLSKDIFLKRLLLPHLLCCACPVRHPRQTRTRMRRCHAQMLRTHVRATGMARHHDNRSKCKECVKCLDISSVTRSYRLRPFKPLPKRSLLLDQFRLYQLKVQPQ